MAASIEVRDNLASQLLTGLDSYGQLPRQGDCYWRDLRKILVRHGVPVDTAKQIAAEGIRNGTTVHLDSLIRDEVAERLHQVGRRYSIEQGSHTRLPGRGHESAWNVWLRLAREARIPQHVITAIYDEVLDEGFSATFAGFLAARREKLLNNTTVSEIEEGASGELDALKIADAVREYGGIPPIPGKEISWDLLFDFLYVHGVPRELSDKIYRDGVNGQGKFLAKQLERAGYLPEAVLSLSKEEYSERVDAVWAQIIRDITEKFGSLPAAGDVPGWTAYGEELRAYHLPEFLIKELVKGGIAGDLSELEKQLKMAEASS